MTTERNDMVWLATMKKFCEELDAFLRCKQQDFSWVRMPRNEDGSFDNLCEMSASCVYRSDINTAKYQHEIFEIQSRARKILVYMGQHPAMKIYKHYTTGTPFFEKALFIALALAVEHQDALPPNHQTFNHLLEAATACS
jgi:hypothetical protein